MLIVLSAVALLTLLMGTAVCARRQAGEDPMTTIGHRLAAGMLLDQALLLTGLPLAATLVAGSLVAVRGAWRLIPEWRTTRAEGGGAFPTWPLLAACALLLLYAFQILAEPIMRWDARSIWFFHARMLWLGDGFRNVAWSHPSLVPSHPDYPKLVPGLAAQLAYLADYWNEFFPKLSLLLLLMPATFWAISFRSRRPSFVALVIVVFGQTQWLSNGYMDGYLFVYAGFALLLYGRYLAEGRPSDRSASLCSLGLVLCLKNEGMLFAAAIAAALVSTALLLRSRPVFSRLSQKPAPTTGVALALAVVPTLLWAGYRVAWGLENDLAAQPSLALGRLLAHLRNPQALLEVGRYLAVTANGLWVVALVAAASLLFCWRARMAVHPGTAVALLTAILYFCGMYVVYLSMPADTLRFYLTTSAARTMAVARVAMFVGVYFVFDALERSVLLLTSPHSR